MSETVEARRGRSAVENALVDAAAELLVEQGPARVGVREIADRAGVNKGQIHHYFGGKQALVEAAFRKLAHEHFDATVARFGGPVPQALALRDDARYWQALARLILDGDLATASVEFDDDVSVPRKVLEFLTRAEGLDAPTAEIKAHMAGVMAIELGWAAFRDFILLAVDAGEAEVDGITARVRALEERTASGASDA